MIKNKPSYFSIPGIGLILLVMVMYYLSARAGLLLAYKNTNATPVWPPSGIALTALLVFGYSIWPGIMLGAFSVNVVVFLSNQTDPVLSLWVSLFISIGNTLAALFGYYLLKKMSGDISKFEKLKHIIEFAFIVLSMCVISSTIGSSVICIAKIITWEQYPIVWFTWWLGDVTGILIIVPLLLNWKEYFETKWKLNKKIISIVLFFGLTFFLSELIFCDRISINSPYIKPYLIIPLLLWAAFYFDKRTLATASAFFSAIAIWGTMNGLGSFASMSMNDSLLSLQMYLSIVCLTILTLKAMINDREQSEALLRNTLDKLMLIAKEQKEDLTRYQKRIDVIFQAILKYTLMDFSQKTIISEKGDEIDAIAAGLNTLSEELGFYVLKLKESEERLRLLVESVKDYAIFMIDTNGYIISWNKGAQNIKGYSSQEIIGKHISIFYTSEELKLGEPEYNLKMAIENGHYETEGWRVRKDGSQFWADVILTPVIDELKNLKGFVKVTRDVSERKIAEEALQTSEEKFNKAFQLSLAGISLINLTTGKYVDANESFLEIIGLEPTEVIGHTSLEINIFDIIDQEKILEEIKKEGSVRNKEVVFKKKSGEKGHLLFSTGLININNESHSLTIIYDITDRIKAETQLKLKSEELVRSNQELEQFAYVASHDLQEPLRMVNSYVQLLSNRYKDKLDEEANDFIDFAVDGSNRMRILIQSLLEYSRVNRVKPFERINTNEVIKEVEHDIKNIIAENNAIIITDKLPDIVGDTVLIGQLFQNLIINAVKFKGTENPKIIISGKKNNDTYLFSVTDNGIGIKKEYAEKIFIIFQRLHGKDKYPGTGIGLAICKKIVERHGGQIWLESEIGKGSTFYFTIKEK